MSTLTIDNFKGSMTIYNYGDINSGRGYEQVNSGANPFIKPGQLTWARASTQIDPAGAVITDMIVAGKERTESGVLYVYAIGHTGRLYKIQVNDPTTYNPDYDNPVLLTTLTINTPTFTRGGSMDFFGATEKIYIGSDVGVTSINFDGTGEAFVGVLGSWTQNVPRPMKQFINNLYVGNGNALVEILQGGSVSTYSKISFYNNTQARDIDVSVDGTYLETVVSRLPLYDITASTQETISPSNSESYIFKWNGTDTGYTAFTTFPSFALSANILFQDYQYTFGTDQFGAAMYNPNQKIVTFPEAPAPLPNAIFSTGNLLGLMTPVYFEAMLQGYLLFWGSNDFEVGNPLGYWSPFFTVATAPETDIIRIPFVLPVSNTGFGASSNNYPNNIFGTSKIYFSQLETSATTTKYRFYKWSIDTSALQSPQNTNALIDAIYQTQTQMFSSKITVSEVRIYGEPWVMGASFRLDLIGSNGLAISGGSQTFTTQNTDANAPMYVGTDYAWWGPDMAPTYAVGVAISNLGSVNHVINKIEIDYSQAGK